MTKDPVVTTYARALLELSSERNELGVVLEEVNVLLGLLTDLREFRTFLLTPSIQPLEKKEVLDRVFSGNITDTLLDFLHVVVAKERQQFLEAMLEEFRALYDEETGRIHVDAVTAVPISDSFREELSSVLSKKLQKTALVANVVTPEILGGMVIRLGDLVVDGSVRTHLKNLHARIEATQLGSEFVHED